MGGDGIGIVIATSPGIQKIMVKDFKETTQRSGDGNYDDDSDDNK